VVYLNMVIICLNPECSKEFSANRKRKYCDSACSNAHKKATYRITSLCGNPNCGVSFESRKSENRKYCSSSCSASVNNKLSPKRSPEGNCWVCSRSIPSNKKYCSDHTLVEEYLTKYERSVECGREDCTNTFKTNSSYRRFCSSTCKNKRIYSGSKPNNTCVCGEKISAYSKFCSPCHATNRKNIRIQSWLDGKWSGGSDRDLSDTIRNYLLELHEYKCSECGFNTPHPVDGKTILEVDHIDGNGSNHSPDNLTVLCPNHHALTPTYRARNKGKGRKVYYLRVDPRRVDNHQTT